MSENIIFSRRWAMANAETFKIKPIKEFVQKYVSQSKISIDPFARNSKFATYTNDINPNTSAEFHFEANEFLDFLIAKNVKADLVILDPPWTCRQISECYKEVGIKVTQKHTQIANFMKTVRDKIDPFLTKNGIVLSFGYNTVGMGIKRKYKIEEIMLVSNGGSHNDVICMAERKL